MLIAYDPKIKQLLRLVLIINRLVLLLVQIYRIGKNNIGFNY